MSYSIFSARKEPSRASPNLINIRWAAFVLIIHWRFTLRGFSLGPAVRLYDCMTLIHWNPVDCGECILAPSLIHVLWKSFFYFAIYIFMDNTSSHHQFWWIQFATRSHTNHHHSCCSRDNPSNCFGVIHCFFYELELELCSLNVPPLRSGCRLRESV